MITYSFASDKDLEDIVSLENSFFGKTSWAPSETKDGLSLFLSLGGEILMQRHNGDLVSCVEIIRVGYLQERNLNLYITSKKSPLVRLHSSGFFNNLNREWNYIHGWISISSEGKWVFKKVKAIYRNSILVGLVLKYDRHAIDSYTRFGKIIGELQNAYGNNEEHYIVKFQNNSFEITC